MTENSTGDTVRHLSDQLGTLIRDELRAALGEMRTKARQAGYGGALLALASVLALYAGGVIVLAFVRLLETILPRWLAATVSGMMLSCAAMLAGLEGAERFQQASPPVPEQTLAEAEDTTESAVRSAQSHSTENSPA